ncbi:hypothetical protein VTK73DRAFT_9859 [Phialemonium thermophilum]|uniref:Uncharacterized protein n=1 Tax=Phialemonium thermophilum TaxID=223376 RepID=A0ABR3XIF5_9PEZI
MASAWPSKTTLQLYPLRDISCRWRFGVAFSISVKLMWTMESRLGNSPSLLHPCPSRATNKQDGGMTDRQGLETWQKGCHNSVIVELKSSCEVIRQDSAKLRAKDEANKNSETIWSI